ncbi:MAG: hypothetical protein QOH42_2599 [Blastocatellia bacterium]|nr:hypothetical protein [Blastocatellia bacterium]
MKICAPTLVLLLISSALLAQSPDAAKSNASAASASNSIPAAPAISASSTPIELARAALAAQGGDKFKHLKSMMLIGSADLYPPNSAQSIPGKFVIVTAGDKVRIEIDARPMFNFKQVYDGQQSYSSMPNVQLPPASKFGLPVLAKFDQPGYTVSALPDKKKLRGFRIVDSEGNTTDFYVDLATARVMQYLTPYNGYTFGTENSKFKEVEGVLVPFNFSQRLEVPQGAFFAEYKVKEVKLNQPIGDDVFVLQ